MLTLLTIFLLLFTQVHSTTGTCAKLSSPISYCPHVTYETTNQDTELILNDIKDSLNDISSRGYDNIGAPCILSFRQALCYQKFIRCDPLTNNIPKVCNWIRNDVLELCSADSKFHDTGPLEEVLDLSRYGDTPDCFPKAVPEVPVVKEKEKPPAEAESAPVITVTVTAPMSEMTATEENDVVKKARVKSHLNSAPDKTCANSDLDVEYGTCKEDGTREMKFAIKRDANCADPWKLIGLSEQVPCACMEGTLSSILTTCSEKGTQNRLWYHRDLLPFTSTAAKPWPCDRRTGLPRMESDVECQKDSDNEIPNETLFGKDSIEISWNGKSSRTGLQKIGCAIPPLNGPPSDDPAAECSSDEQVEDGSGFKESADTFVARWTMKDTVAHSDTPPPGSLSFLELDVTSSAGATSPWFLFTFSVNSAPHFYGLQFLLDGVIAMPLTTNQTEFKSYAVALEPGKAHIARWEYLTGPDGWVFDMAVGEGYRAVLQNVYLTNAVPRESGADNTEDDEQEDTGISLSLVAGALLLGVVAVGGAVFLSRRRRRRKDLGGFVGVEYTSNGDKEFVFLHGKEGPREENLELENLDVFGDSDNDDSSNHGSEAQDRIETVYSYPAPATPFLDVDSEDETLVGVGVGTG